MASSAEVIKVIESLLNAYNSSPKYLNFDVLGTYNRAFLNFITTSNFSKTHVFTAASLCGIPPGLIAQATIAGLRAVDLILTAEDRFITPFSLRLLKMSASNSSAGSVTKSDPSKTISAQGNGSATLENTKAPTPVYARRQKRSYVRWAKIQVKSNKPLFPTYGCEIGCKTCVHLFSNVPLSWCEGRHGGSACSPIGLFPHVKATNFKAFHNGKATPRRFFVAKGKFPNPLSAEIRWPATTGSTNVLVSGTKTSPPIVCATELNTPSKSNGQKGSDQDCEPPTAKLQRQGNKKVPHKTKVSSESMEVDSTRSAQTSSSQPSHQELRLIQSHLEAEYLNLIVGHGATVVQKPRAEKIGKSRR